MYESTYDDYVDGVDNNRTTVKKRKYFLMYQEYALNDVIKVDTIAINCFKINDTQCRKNI